MKGLARELASAYQSAYHLAGKDDEACSEALRTLDELSEQAEKSPTIVCLCGSTRFAETFNEQNRNLTLEGKIVLSIGCHRQYDEEIFANWPDDYARKVKAMLDELHKRKIDLADEVLILNVGGYIGDSTRSELEYARKQGKTVRFLEAEC